MQEVGHAKQLIVASYHCIILLLHELQTSYSSIMHLYLTGLTYLAVLEYIVERVSWQYVWIVIDLIKSYLYARNHTTAGIKSSKGEHKGQEYRTGRSGVGLAAAVVSRNVHWRVNLLVAAIVEIFSVVVSALLSSGKHE